MAEEPSKPNADLPVILQSPADLSLKPEGEVPSKKSFDEMMAGVADKIREQMKLSPNREPSKQENEESAEPAEVHEKLTIPIFAMVLSDDLFLLQVAIKNLFRMKKSKTLNFIFLRNVATLPSFVLTNLCTEDIEGVGPIHFRCPMMRYFTWEVKLSELFGGEVGPAKKGDILSFHFDENMKYQVKATFAGIESKYALPFTHPSEPVFFGLRFDRKELYLENFDAMQEILAPIACLESVISVLDYLHSTAKPEQCDICTFDIHKEVLIPCGHVLCRRCCHRIPPPLLQ
ncbi:hypothetical protein L596_001581 [Steinernema carpocapsae]|uniref:Uncharacterized protein n=1 Tax=Steinernema carpocapsae TaxID=34508 RepID=A0A4V6I7F4_STECR|nr:hypothetical protein L596_001581 [Steinernema carpocapsae]